MARLVDVCSVDQIPPHAGREFLIEDRTIAIWNIGGRLFATDARCPHAGAPLVGGILAGTEVACPMHGWSFDVTSGQGIDPPEPHIRSYRIAVRGDRICVELE